MMFHDSIILWYECSIFAPLLTEAVALYCPNLPYYGGFVGLAGVRAFSCPIEEDFEAYDIQITEDCKYDCTAYRH